MRPHSDITPNVFPYDDFVDYFPQLSPPVNSPEMIVACGKRAMMYMSRYESVWLNGEHKKYAICLLGAHVLYLTNKVNNETADGSEAAIGPVTSSSVGGVSVSMQTPNSSGDGPFEWWLNKSPYGQEFLALIRTRGPMMAFVGSRTPVLPLR